MARNHRWPSVVPLGTQCRLGVTHSLLGAIARARLPEEPDGVSPPVHAHQTGQGQLPLVGSGGDAAGLIFPPGAVLDTQSHTEIQFLENTTLFVQVLTRDGNGCHGEFF